MRAALFESGNCKYQPVRAKSATLNPKYTRPGFSTISSKNNGAPGNLYSPFVESTQNASSETLNFSSAVPNPMPASAKPGIIGACQLKLLISVSIVIFINFK
jgi:hypothetical protein